MMYGQYYTPIKICNIKIIQEPVDFFTAVVVWLQLYKGFLFANN